MVSRRSFTAGAVAAAGMIVLPSAEAEQDAAWTGGSSLKAHAAARGLLAGMAVNMDRLNRDAAYARTLVEQCSIVVAENAMKWAPLRPAPDRFFFDEADAFVAFAQQHGMAIRGHNLCWHQGLPGWFGSTVNPGNAERYLVEHIHTVAGRYKGKIRAWDVVNEAIELKDGLPDGFRGGPWFKLLGPRFVEVAFRATREADPHALLTYNDYGIETDDPQQTAKRAAVLALLQHLKKAGVPLDAVGIQSHISAGSASQIGAGLAAFLEQCQDLGFKVFVTELDVNDDEIAAENPAERSTAVGSIYGDYLRLLIRNSVVTDVLTWGVANRLSWLNAASGAKFRPKHPTREEQCLPFNDAYQPEPAFFAMRDAFGTRRV